MKNLEKPSVFKLSAKTPNPVKKQIMPTFILSYQIFFFYPSAREILCICIGLKRRNCGQEGAWKTFPVNRDMLRQFRAFPRPDTHTSADLIHVRGSVT